MIIVKAHKSKLALYGAIGAKIAGLVLGSVGFALHLLSLEIPAAILGTAAFFSLAAWALLHVRRMEAREQALGYTMSAVCGKLGVDTPDATVTDLQSRLRAARRTG